jgi:tetratricopeptide (TPR) repeat protein
MSILLEALRQKSRNESDTYRHDAPALTLSADIPSKSEHSDNKGDDHALTLESLLEPLQIQPPQHLDWQLSAADTHKQEVVTDAPLEAAHTFDHQALELLFPVADDHLMVTEQVSEAPALSTEEAMPELMTWSLDETTQTDPVAREANLAPFDQVDLLETEAAFEAQPQPWLAETDVEMVLGNAEMDTFEVDSEPLNAPVEQVPSATEFAYRSEVTTEAPIAVEMTPTPSLSSAKVNSAASASSYLNLLNQKKQPEQPVLVKKIRLQKPSLSPSVLIGAMLVATASGIGYYGYSLWEADQAQLVNQMARYEEPISLPTQNNDSQQPLIDTPSNASVAPDEKQSMESGNLPAPVLGGVSSDQIASVNAAIAQSATSEPKKRRQTVVPAYSPRQETISVTKGLATSTLLNSAWNSWRQGDVVAAEQAYRHVLERQPNNRDALMGMFAITQVQPATAAQSQDIAERLIDLYPQDEEVKTLVSSVLSVGGSSDKSESALKNQLQQTPNNAAIHYQLGIFYANTKRWSEAQSAFFKAVSLDAGQPEYLANLAISYDQLGKTDLAMAGYQRALEAARVRPSSLSQEALLARLQFLSLQTSNGE